MMLSGFALGSDMTGYPSNRVNRVIASLKLVPPEFSYYFVKNPLVLLPAVLKGTIQYF